jgi:hypothetical protein
MTALLAIADCIKRLQDKANSPAEIAPRVSCRSLSAILQATKQALVAGKHDRALKRTLGKLLRKFDAETAFPRGLTCAEVSGALRSAMNELGE